MSRKAVVRHCLVTGANRGIGLEFVRQLLARGDRVVAGCRQPGKATALNHLAGDYPGRLRVLPLDVANARSREAFAHELPLVCERLDLLVNTAGVLHSGERFGQLTEANFDDSFRINASGPLLLTQALAPLLADGAVVANLSSILGSIAPFVALQPDSELGLPESEHFSAAGHWWSQPEIDALQSCQGGVKFRYEDGVGDVVRTQVEVDRRRDHGATDRGRNGDTGHRHR